MSVSPAEIYTWRQAFGSRPVDLSSPRIVDFMNAEVAERSDRLTAKITDRLETAERWHWLKKIFEIRIEQTDLGDIVHQSRIFFNYKNNPDFYAHISTLNGVSREIAITPVNGYSYKDHDQAVPMTWTLHMNRVGRDWNLISFSAQTKVALKDNNNLVRLTSMRITPRVSEQTVQTPLDDSVLCINVSTADRGASGPIGLYNQLGFQLLGSDERAFVAINPDQSAAQGKFQLAGRQFAIDTGLHNNFGVLAYVTPFNHGKPGEPIMQFVPGVHGLDTLFVAEQAVRSLDDRIRYEQPKFW